jgi:REP element-mobilizing transposase RayT
MVIAYHAIWSAYGFWLPNEQRGSWSTEVWASHLRRFGPATKTTENRSLANRPYDPNLRREARDSLKYPAVRFTLEQIECISRGFADAIERFGINLHACAILWDHVHIVSQRHREPIEFVARVLKSAATRQLTQDGLHPLAKFAKADGRAPTPWADGGWERYLNNPVEIGDAMRYVNGNPEKHGLAKQDWPFVRAFE